MQKNKQANIAIDGPVCGVPSDAQPFREYDNGPTRGQQRSFKELNDRRITGYALENAYVAKFLVIIMLISYIRYE